VVVVGAGFGGITAARELAHSRADIFLIDRNNYHTFTPLLYQVAAAEVDPSQIAYPVRSIVRRHDNVHFVLGDVKNIDFDRQLVSTDELLIYYDYVILGLGSVSNFYNISGAEEQAYQVKTLDQANDLRNQILRCFEHATHELDDIARRRLLTFSIIGGGPTGVEFAGALIELVKGPLKKDFPTINTKDVRIILIEADSTVLNQFTSSLKEYATRRLGKMGVELHLNAKVDRIERGQIHLADGRTFISNTIIWAVGVKANPMVQKWGLETGRGGMVPVQSTLQAVNFPNVYVIGDLALLKNGDGPLPMLAPVAIQEGKAAARNIARRIKNKEQIPFKYRDPGTLATIGRNAAVAQFTHWNFTGFFAWLLWVFVHLAKIIGFRNRLLVLINWAWDYFFFDRAVRLIIPSERERAFAMHESSERPAPIQSEKMAPR
jgi:NADH dehydrogenase